MQKFLSCSASCGSKCVRYLHTEGQAVLLEGVEVENQLLTSFSQRSQVPIAVHIDGPSLQNLGRRIRGEVTGRKQKAQLVLSVATF